MPGVATCSNGGRVEVDVPINSGALHILVLVAPAPGTFPGNGFWGVVINNGSGPPEFGYLASTQAQGSGTFTINADLSGTIDASLPGTGGTTGTENVKGAWTCKK